MFCPFLHVIFFSPLSVLEDDIGSRSSNTLQFSWPFNAIGCKHDLIQDSEKVSESGILNPCLDMIRFGDFSLSFVNLES